MPIRVHCLRCAVHHDRPISVSFLDCRRGCEKLNKEGVPIAVREVVHDFGYRRICLSKSFRQACYVLGILVADVLALKYAAGAIQLAVPQQIQAVPRQSFE